MFPAGLGGPTGLSRRLAWWGGAWTLAALVALAAPEAGAQQRLSRERLVVDPESSTIGQRFSSEFASPGVMRLGTFNLRGLITEDVAYDDNVFATKNKRGDFISLTGGGARLQSDWQRHAAYAGVNAGYFAFARFTDQDEWLGTATTGGHLDVSRDLRLGFDLSAGRLVDQRGDPDSINNAAQPVIYNLYRIEPWAEATTGVFKHQLAVQGETTTYFNAETSTGQPINLAAQEYAQVRAGYRIGYIYFDPHELFARASVQDRRSTNDAGVSRQNFSIYSAEVGAAFQVSPLVTAFLAGGLQHVTNDNPAISGTDVPTIDLRIAWEPTRTLRLEARAVRDFASSVVSGFTINSPGYIRMLAGLTAITEIRHGLLGTAGAYVINRDYIDSDTNQQVYGFDLGLRYAVGQGWALGANYLWRYESQDYDYTYSRNLFLARITKTF